jgi:hypothetical protein
MPTPVAIILTIACVLAAIYGFLRLLLWAWDKFTKGGV